jgi:hypothetical protein
MPKLCTKCNDKPRWARGLCLACDKIENKHKYEIKNKDKGVSTTKATPIVVKRSFIKPKPRKTTGEYTLFLKIYAERKGICQITGEQIPFNINSFLHILGKGAYPSLRLLENNILMVKSEIHHLYDNSSKEKLLEKYPRAYIIYELKDKLRYEYYNS